MAYLGGGWLVLEGIGLLVEQAVFPDVIFGLALVVYIAGIPASMVIGWHHGEKGRQGSSLPEVGLLTVITIGTLLAGVYVVREYRAAAMSAGAGDINSSLDAREVAVLYFDDRSEDGRFRHIADGLTEDLIHQLDRVGSLNVVPSNGTVRFRGSDLAIDSIARLLHAGTIIRGTVEPEDDSAERLRVSFRLLDGVSGTEFRRQSRVWSADSLLTARRELAQDVTGHLREWLGEEIRLRVIRREASSSAAWALVQRAAREVEAAEASLAGDDPETARTHYAEADSLLTRATEIDSDWSEPFVQRGWISLERAQPGMSENAEEAGRWLQAGLEQARQALEVDPLDASALELRGTLRYEQYSLRITPEGMDRGQLVELARTDLERAVDLTPGLASAWATLSHLYYQVSDFPAAVLAARQAYQHDYYLRTADTVLWRLFVASYDLEDYHGARRWCEEGRRRFPGDWHFVNCQLWLMTMGAADPDVEPAWALYRKMENLLPEARSTIQLAEARAVVGGIIGRAAAEAPEGTSRRTALYDSADAVLRRARLAPGEDPEQNWLWWESVMRTLMDQHDQAVQLLERYTATNPGHFTPERAIHWWWTDLKGHPDFERMRELQTEGQ